MQKSIYLSHTQQAIKTLSFLFILLIQFRVFAHESLALSDVVFVPLLLLLWVQLLGTSDLVRSHNTRINFIVATFVVIWAASYLAPAFAYPDLTQYITDNLFMLAGALYLILVLVIFYFIGLLYGFNFIAKSFIFAGLVHALLGVFGLLLYLVGLDNTLVCFECSTSPYLSNLPRVSGLSSSINAYAFSLLVSLIFIPTQMTHKNKKMMLLVGAFIFLAILLSLSKIMVIASLSIILWWVFLTVRISARAPVITILTVVASVFYLLITHVSIEPHSNKQCKYGSAIYELKGYDGARYKICPTFFVQQKRYYWHYAQDFSPWGSGVSNVENTNNAKPHNTFLERYAFHGILGIFSLLFLIVLVVNIFSPDKRRLVDDRSTFAIGLFWVSLLLISINSDVLRYRELWLLLGVSMAYALSRSKELK